VRGVTALNTIDAAREFAQRGLAVIPVPRGAKSPAVKGWNQLRISPNDVSQHFAADGNIAILNGEASGGFVNVDLDSPEALPIAECFLPQTELIHGRHSKTGSHWWYSCPDKAPEQRKFIDPTTTNGKSVCLLELISNNRLTLLPPSIHPSGEAYRWEKSGKPARVDASVLTLAVEKLAAASLFARHWSKGSRHECAMAIAGMLLRAGWSEEETKNFLYAVATAANDEERGTRVLDVATTAKRLAGGQNTFGAPRLKSLVNPAVVDRALEWLHIRVAATAAKPVSAVTRPYSEIAPQQLRWLWPGRIPLGKMSLLIGEPGFGKSLVTIDIVSCVTRGAEFPDGARCGVGSVLLLSAEDDPADTVRPRLDAAGADVSRVHVVEAVRAALTDGSVQERPFDLVAGIAALEEALTRIPNVRLIVIDPISAYLGNTDSNVNAEVRGLLAPLAALAAKYGVAVLAVTHLRKSAGAAVHRAIASIGFAAAARAVWAVAPDPSDPERRLMIPVKQNLAANTGGLAFRVEAPNGLAKVSWESGAVTLDASDVLGDLEDREDRSVRQEAESLLSELLVDGPVSVKKIQAEAKAAGLAWRTVERAKRSLGVLAAKGDFHAGWEWRLHEDRQPINQTWRPSTELLKSKRITATHVPKTAKLLLSADLAEWRSSMLSKKTLGSGRSPGRFRACFVAKPRPAPSHCRST
jgi:putative DNA primase/helicase